MKVPIIGSFKNFNVSNYKVSKNKTPPFNPIIKDTLTFQSSTATYLKKYNSLPEGIKESLSPKDAIDMFKDMERIDNGTINRIVIGEGNDGSRVYENPWLDNYFILIVPDPTKKMNLIFSRHNLGDSVWEDKDNKRLQIIRKNDTN